MQDLQAFSDFATRIVSLIDQDQYAEALRAFKAGKGAFPQSYISQNTNLLAAMLRALYAEGHVDAAFAFVNIYIGTLHPQTPKPILEILLMLSSRKLQELSAIISKQTPTEGESQSETERVAEEWIARVDLLEQLLGNTECNTPTLAMAQRENTVSEPDERPAGGMNYEDKGSTLPLEFRGLQTGTVLEIYEGNRGLLKWDLGEVEYEIPGNPPYASSLTKGVRVMLVWVEEHDDILPHIMGLAR